MNMAEKEKMSVQRWILGISIFIFVTKLSAYYLTYSMGILSDALESTVNVFTGIMTYFSLKYSIKPKDADHPYGHGKIELITASIEGILIALAGFYIIFESVHRFYYPSPIHDLNFGILLIGFCGVLNFIVATYSVRVGKKQNSMALIAGGQHLKTDTYTSIGLILGLVLVLITKITWLDSAIAIVFGLIIWKGAYDILRHTMMGLMDKVDMLLLDRLIALLSKKKKKEWIYGHKLAVLHFGHVIHVDMHLTLPYYFTLQQSLEEVRELKKVMLEGLDQKVADISIQTEPCHPGLCRLCNFECSVRSFRCEQNMLWDLPTLTSGNQYKVN